MAQRLAIIGYGTIATLALNTLAQAMHEPLNAVIVLAKPGSEDRAWAMLSMAGARLARETHVVSDVRSVLALSPDVVAEAAGHEALIHWGVDALAAGKPLIVTSVGALSSESLLHDLNAAAAAGRTHWRMIAGAAGGLDILRAAKLSGLEEVIYTSRKPPRAWKGTRAETLCDLDSLRDETVFFEGDARAAARDYPQNANVAATIALSGAGFEATRVRLVADPAVNRNVHELQVRAGCAQFSVRIEGLPSPDNPKTSLTTAYSLCESVLEHIERN